MAAIHQAAQKAQVMQCYPFPGGITDFPVGDKTFFDEIPRRNKWNLKFLERNAMLAHGTIGRRKPNEKDNI